MARRNPPRIPCDQVPEPTDDPTLAMLDTDAMEDNLEALGDEIALLRAQLAEAVRQRDEATARASRLEAERDAWLCTGCQPVNRDRR